MPWYRWVAAGFMLVSLLVLLVAVYFVMVRDAIEAKRSGDTRTAWRIGGVLAWVTGLLVAWLVLHSGP